MWIPCCENVTNGNCTSNSAVLPRHTLTRSRAGPLWTVEPFLFKFLYYNYSLTFLSQCTGNLFKFGHTTIILVSSIQRTFNCKHCIQKKCIILKYLPTHPVLACIPLLGNGHLFIQQKPKDSFILSYIIIIYYDQVDMKFNPKRVAFYHTMIWRQDYLNCTKLHPNCASLIHDSE